MLVVGANDPQVLELNLTASQSLGGEYRLEIIPGASHLFEEPGALEEATSFARESGLNNIFPQSCKLSWNEWGQ